MENLIPNTWWTDSKNRTWVILSAPLNPFYDEDNILNFKPAGYVLLLEYGKADTIEQPYDLIKDYITQGTFKQVTT